MGIYSGINYEVVDAQKQVHRSFCEIYMQMANIEHHRDNMGIIGQFLVYQHVPVFGGYA